MSINELTDVSSSSHKMTLLHLVEDTDWVIFCWDISVICPMINVPSKVHSTTRPFAQLWNLILAHLQYSDLISYIYRTVLIMLETLYYFNTNLSDTFCFIAEWSPLTIILKVLLKEKKLFVNCYVSTCLRNCMRTKTNISAVQNFLRGNTAYNSIETRHNRIH